MTDRSAQLARLQTLCRGAELWDDATGPVVHLPEIKVESGGSLHTVDALLWPAGRDGYDTRLFFSAKLPVNRNWQVYNVLTKTWHAISWNGISGNQPWLDILAGHLEAVK